MFASHDLIHYNYCTGTGHYWTNVKCNRIEKVFISYIIARWTLLLFINVIMEKDITEIKTNLQFIIDEFNMLKTERKNDKKSIGYLTQEVSKLTDVISELKETIKTKDTIIANMQDSIDDLQQQTRKNNVIISGLDLRTYSEVTQKSKSVNQNVSSIQTEHDQNDGNMVPKNDSDRIEGKVLNFFKTKMKVNINSDQVSTLKFIPNRNGDKNILVQFVSCKTKFEVLKNGKKLKGEKDIYVNEHLTSRNAQIFKKARELKKKKIVLDAWTRDCKVFLKTSPQNQSMSKVLHIKSMDDFSKFNLI